MIKRIQAFLRTDVFRVLSASIGIQTLGYALSLALTPFAIAFYTPTDFGRFAVVFFAASLIGGYGGLRLEWALINEHSNRAAQVLLRFILTLMSAAAALVLAGVLLMPGFVWDRLEVGRADMIWAAPIAVAIGVGLFLQSFGIRRQLFPDVYFSRNLIMVLRQVLQIGFGVIHASVLALILAELLARTLGNAVIVRRLGTRLLCLAPARFYRLAGIVLLRRYGHYTKVAFPSSLIDFAMTESLAVLLLLVQGAEVAGAYWLVVRIFALPMALIGTVVGDVFQGRMAREKDRNIIWRYMVHIALLLAAFSALLLPIGAIALRLVTEHIYDGRWALSGILAVILVPALCVQFVASPLSRSMIVLKRMQYKYIFDLSLLLALTTWITATALLKLDLIASMVLLSATQVIAYLIYIALSLWVVREAESG